MYDYKKHIQKLYIYKLYLKEFTRKLKHSQLKVQKYLKASYILDFKLSKQTF